MAPLVNDPILTNIVPVGAEDIHHPDTKQFIANSWKRFGQAMDTRGRDERLALLRNLTKEWEENYRRKWQAASTSGVMMDIRDLAARSGLTAWLSRQPTPTSNEVGNYYARLVDYSAAINDTVGDVSPHLAFAAHRVANVRPNDTVCVNWAGDGLIATFLEDRQNVQFSDPNPLRRAIFNQLYPGKYIDETGRAVEGGFDILFTKGVGPIPIRMLLNRVSPGGRLVIYGDSDSLRMFSSMIQNLGKYNTIPEFIVSLPPTLNAEIARTYIDMFIQLEDFDRKVAGNFTFKVDGTGYESEGGTVIVIDNVPGTETNSEIFNMVNTQARPLSDYISSFDKVRNTRTGSSKEMVRHQQIQGNVKRKHEQAEIRRKAAVHNAANRDGAKIFRNHPEIELKVKTIARKAIAGNLIPKGTRYESIEELAVIADVARNPSMPTTQILLVQDGTIQASVLGGVRTGEDVRVSAEQTGILLPDTEADGYDVISVVNRPSGDTTISDADIQQACELAFKYEGFQYLLIKNGDTYSVVIVNCDESGKPVSISKRNNVAIDRPPGTPAPQVARPSWAPEVDAEGADALVASIRQNFEQIHSQHIDVLFQLVDAQNDWAVVALMNQDGTLADMVEIPNSFNFDQASAQLAIDRVLEQYGGVDAYLFLASANQITNNPQFFQNTGWGQYLSNNPNIRGHMLVGAGTTHLANRVKTYAPQRREGELVEMARQVSPNMIAELPNKLAQMIENTPPGNIWEHAKALYAETLGRDLTRTQSFTALEEAEFRHQMNTAVSKILQKHDIKPNVVDADTAVDKFRELSEMMVKWQEKATKPLNGRGQSVDPAHAFLMHYLAGVGSNDVVVIPDAGSSTLTGFSNRHAQTLFTESDPVRRAQLKDILGVQYVNDAASTDLANYWQNDPHLQLLQPNVVLLDSRNPGTFWQQLNQSLHTVEMNGRVVAHLNIPMVEVDGEIDVDPAFYDSIGVNLEALKQFYQVRMFALHDNRMFLVVDRVEQADPNLGFIFKSYEDAEAFLRDAESVRDTRSGIQLAEKEMMPDEVVDTTGGTQEIPQEIDQQAEGQEKHMKPIDVSQAREFHIRQICKERNITTLVHFTRIENLRSILQDGLIGRSLLEARGQQFLFNDNDRVDGHKEAVCLSISFPNYQMFYSIREKKKETQEANDSQWIILLLDAKVLWELDCAFCQDNAARKAISNTSLESRKRSDALETMFGDFYNIKHQDLQIPDPYLMHPKKAYPTHPQAEVLVFDSISVQFIKAIHFWNETTLEQWRSNYENSQIFSVNQQYFRARPDYEVWKSDNFNSEGIPLSYIAASNTDIPLSVSDNDDDDIPF